jgi:hypothetical protein
MDYRGQENKGKVKLCRAYKESECRLNTNMLHHFINIGGPLLLASGDLQKQLVAQICNVQIY